MPHPELSGLAHVALDLGAHGRRAGGAVELVEAEPLRRFPDVPAAALRATPR